MAASIVYFPPVMDAYVAEYYPDTNFGPVPYLYSNRYQGEGDIYRTYIEFSLCYGCNYIPPNSCIECAYLYLPIYRNEFPCNRELYAHRVLESWDEYSITWNNQPLYDPVPATQTTIAPGFLGTVCLNVTDVVVGWYMGYYANFGLLLRCDECIDSLIGFYSREFPNSDYWPRLVVYYTENCCVPRNTISSP